MYLLVLDTRNRIFTPRGLSNRPQILHSYTSYHYNMYTYRYAESYLIMFTFDFFFLSFYFSSISITTIFYHRVVVNKCSRVSYVKTAREKKRGNLSITYCDVCTGTKIHKYTGLVTRTIVMCIV